MAVLQQVAVKTETRVYLRGARISFVCLTSIVHRPPAKGCHIFCPHRFSYSKILPPAALYAATPLHDARQRRFPPGTRSWRSLQDSNTDFGCAEEGERWGRNEREEQSVARLLISGESRLMRSIFYEAAPPSSSPPPYSPHTRPRYLSSFGTSSRGPFVTVSLRCATRCRCNEP